MIDTQSYQSIITALREHRYHKLIIGAALKDYEAIENYAYLFTHAGAEVIDISAFPHSVISARKGIARAIKEKPGLREPFVMVSVNIGTDPHFRRIKVDFDKCTDCLLCEPVCPSNAFSLQLAAAQQLQYNEDLCFACTNCLDYCHFDALSFKDWSAFEAQSIEHLIELGASAFEIHLSNDLDAFKDFYASLPELPPNFLQSFSIGSEMMNARELNAAAEAVRAAVRAKYGGGQEFILQTDGIPISGARAIADKDLASIVNAREVLANIDDQNVFVQLAGGVDESSLAKAHAKKVLVHGVAMGSYARKALQADIDLALASKDDSDKGQMYWNHAKDKANELIKKSKSKLQNLSLEVQCI